MHVAFQAHEPLENSLLLIGRHAISLIDYADAHLLLQIVKCGSDAQGRARRRVAQGVGDQVAQNLFQACFVGPDADLFVDIQFCLALFLQDQRFKEIEQGDAGFFEGNGAVI